MNWKYSYYPLFSLLALVFSVGNVFAEKEEHDEKALHNLQCRITLDRKEYKVGEPINVSFELQNLGEVPIQVCKSSEPTGRMDGYDFEIQTKQDEILRDPMNEYISTTHALGSFRTIEPGKTYVRNLSLNYRVQPLKPGVYSVIGIYHLKENVKIESERVDFKILQTLIEESHKRVKELEQRIDREEGIDTLARLLGFTGNVTAIPALIKILQISDDHAQVAAAEALLYIDHDAVRNALKELLKKKGPRVRMVDLMCVRLQMSSKDMVPLLLPWLDNTDEDRRFAAVEGLYLYQATSEKDPKLFPYLKSMLKDPSAKVRLKAAAAVGCYKDAKALEALKTLINDPDEYVQEQVTIAIGWQGTAEAVDILSKILKTKGCPAQQAAYWLGEIGDKRAIDVLKEVTQYSDDSRLKQEAENALKKLRTK